MRIALISDIHGNLQALEMALERAQELADEILCLGDLVDGGDSDLECIRAIRRHAIPCVMGNHDELFVTLRLAWASDMSEAAFLSRLPIWLEREGIYFIHDDPALLTQELANRSFAFPKSQAHAEELFASAGVFAYEPRIVAIGHIHRPAIFSSAGELEFVPGKPVSLLPEVSYILSPGTVGGKPRSGWGNTFGILDTCERSFCIHRLNIPAPRTMWDEFFERTFKDKDEG